MNKNEITPEIAALHSLNPFAPNNASARSVMFAGHFSQRPVIHGSEPNTILSGLEDEFGKYTFSVDMPEDGTIIKIIPRYSQAIGESQIDANYTDSVVIYRMDDGTFDYFVLPYYRTNGTSFGFKYEPKPALSELYVGRSFEKGTVFLDSPAIKGKSHYTYGRNLNVAIMSHPNTGLDGYVISEDVLPQLASNLYETRTIEFGATDIPLNLYGTDDDYQPFPKMGEYIKPSGLVGALRRHDALLSPALTSAKDLQEVNHFFDRCVYSRAGVGRVVGYDVIHTTNVNRQLPPEMTKHLWPYVNSSREFYRQIIAFEEQQLKEIRRYDRDAVLKCTPALSRLLSTSRPYVNYPTSDGSGKPVVLMHKKERLDAWRVTLTIEYTFIPGRGSKLTCMNGGGLK